MEEGSSKTLAARRRFLIAVAVAAVSLLTSAPASFEASDPAVPRFSLLPPRALAGEGVTVSVARARAGALCSLAVDYSKGSTQTGLTPATAIGGHASWSWTIPATTQASVAKLSVACGGSKRISGRLLVIGSLIPPRLSVEKDGFSTRTSTNGSTDVSYGIVIHNESPNADALNVNVLVNFVLGNDHLLGSTSSTIPAIAAGTSYALGGNMNFPAAAPIGRLEIVMQVGGSQKHEGHPPALDNVVIEPSLYDQGWVGDVAGEVINNDPSVALQSVRYSAVILDAAGNVLGGGNGSSYGTLPPGTRMVFKLTGGGFRDISVEKATSVLVSASPTWQRAGP
jgi:hypothetical protein